MSLDMSNPLDRLYMETIPTRPSTPGAARMDLGPTGAFMLSQLVDDVMRDEEEQKIAAHHRKVEWKREYDETRRRERGHQRIRVLTDEEAEVA